MKREGRSEPASFPGLKEHSFFKIPRNLDMTRGSLMSYGEKIVTTYTPIDDDTEWMRWETPLGTGAQWKQRWVGGLATAPSVGESYLVTHDEWIASDSEDGYPFLRIIHKWRYRGDAS